MRYLFLMLVTVPLYAMEKSDSTEDIKVTISHAHRRQSLDDEMKNYIKALVEQALKEKEEDIQRHRSILDEEVRRSRVAAATAAGTALVTAIFNLIMGMRG